MPIQQLSNSFILGAFGYDLNKLKRRKQYALRKDQHGRV